MVERSDEIKQRIDAQRGELGENLHELERRVKSGTDWRAHMEKRPWVMLGAAFGTGMLISGILARGGHSSSYSYQGSYSDLSASDYNTSKIGESRFKNVKEQRHRAAEALDKMTGALIAVGVQKLQDVLKDAIPGFGDKYEATESRGQDQGLPIQGQTSRQDETYGEYGRSEAGRYDRSPSTSL